MFLVRESAIINVVGVKRRQWCLWAVWTFWVSDYGMWGVRGWHIPVWGLLFFLDLPPMVRKGPERRLCTTWTVVLLFALSYKKNLDLLLSLYSERLSKPFRISPDPSQHWDQFVLVKCLPCVTSNVDCQTEEEENIQICSSLRWDVNRDRKKWECRADVVCVCVWGGFCILTGVLLLQLESCVCGKLLNFFWCCFITDILIQISFIRTGWLFWILSHSG